MSEKVLARCKNCRYWKYDDWHQLYTCDHPKMVKGYTSDPTPDGGVTIEDDEGWGWETSPNFGCVNFTKKEKSNAR